ncbi:MAG: hypothetical protein IJ009_00735 [Clostridia bacterium]|nr:hypothetical protein [Clostridia bacterium]
MKKIVCMLLVLVTLFSVAACADKGFDYQKEDLTPFVTLAPYASEKLKADCAKLEALITDADVNEEIDAALAAALAFYKKITEETELIRGDMIGLTYKGVLASTLETAKYGKDGLTTDGQALTEEQVKALTAISGANVTTAVNYMIGKGQYTSSTNVYSTLYNGLLDDGLAELKVGAKYAPIAVTFPEDYKDSALAGQEAVFFVSVEYKWQAEDARDLDYGDIIVVTYVGKLADEYANYAELFKEEYGELSENAVTEVITLEDAQGDTPNLFHAFLKTSFNDLDGESKDNFGREFTDRLEYMLTVQDDSSEEPKTEDAKVEVEYTVTVHSLANVRCFVAQDVVDGTLAYKNEETEDDEETTTEKAFVDYLGIDTETYATYEDYFKGLKEDMQDARDIQIAANEYQAAFGALVEASTITKFEDNETLSELKQKYIDEVRGNIDYLARSVEASGYASLYCQMAGVSTVEEYAMSVYGYNKTNIDKQLPIDAEEYVTNRLVFWQFVKTYEGGLTISDEEYDEGVKKYGEMKGDENFMESYGYTEEAVREALLWDKVCKTLIDNGYVELNYVTPVED